MDHIRFRCTTDKIIRVALKQNLLDQHHGEQNTKIVEELGLRHGIARIDIAVINGILHGYELKSDADTLDRLPSQMEIYNSIFDKVTLVVGKHHIFSAITLIPEWWGVVMAKIVQPHSQVQFIEIRKSQKKKRLKDKALTLTGSRSRLIPQPLEIEKAEGFRSKRRDVIYERLVENLNENLLNRVVRQRLLTREDWRSDQRRATYDG